MFFGRHNREFREQNFAHKLEHDKRRFVKFNGLTYAKIYLAFKRNRM